ncbi:ComF family protein [Ectothiorhodospira mobilis]|uniref:ComF family protein n=1 Tax=Ectothiorhodospira mobilis TaxID=195064 RepID=UPI001EE7A8F4|nr:ComF family protein [Ectothiorhodospira mobilis]MCG5536158.1 ComF family protein [Ectothiorhodospira mobilis]
MPHPLWSRIGGALVETLYPPLCLCCGAPGQGGMDLCPDCARELPLAGPACQRCARPLPAAAGPICGDCLRHPPAFDAARAALRYQWPVDTWIARFKFRGRLNHGRLLARLMARQLLPGAQPPDCILPVPLHRHRLAQRGFNQAAELARPLARALQVPLVPDAVRRTRATPPQQTLSAARRRHNLRGAFTVRAGFTPGHVLLVDDVMTTGSTLDELARRLKAAGVRRVEVWVAARA